MTYPSPGPGYQSYPGYPQPRDPVSEMRRISSSALITNLIDVAILIVFGILLAMGSQISYFGIVIGYNWAILLPGIFLIIVGLLPIYGLLTLLTVITPSINVGNFARVRDGAVRARHFALISRIQYGQLQRIAESLAPGYPGYAAGPPPAYSPGYPPPPPPPP
jgi:hypothetical protein